MRNIEELKKIEATFSITLDAECPYCNEDIDFMDDYDVYSRIPTANTFSHENLDIECCCPHCKKEFILDRTYY